MSIFAHHSTIPRSYAKGNAQRFSRTSKRSLLFGLQFHTSHNFAHLVHCLSITLCFCLWSLVAEADDIECLENQVCRNKSTSLPLRALPRPFSNIWATPDRTTNKILEENVRAFFPLYIFDRVDVDLSKTTTPAGWYAVGSTTDLVSGWMRAEDLVEWHQSLVVTYTHPGIESDQRKQVMFFDDLDLLKVLATAENRLELLDNAYGRIERNERPPDGLISIEPRDFIDIRDQFYILPVLAWEESNIYDDPTRLLQVTAAIPNQRAAQSSEFTFNNPDFSEKISSSGSDSITHSQELNVDIVFVMDMTGSMQPYLDLTKEAMIDFVNALSAQASIKDRIRFGLIGYRDNPDKAAQLEFRTRTFTPSLVPADSIVELLLTEAKASPTTPDEWAEDVYAGVLAATEVEWRESSVRLVVLVGDASAHTGQDAANSTGLDAPRVREFLTNNNIYVTSVYLRNPAAEADYENGDRQFRTLATNPGLTSQNYVSFDAKDEEGYRHTVKTLADSTLTFINVVDSGEELTASTLRSAYEGEQIANSNTESGDRKTGVAPNDDTAFGMFDLLQAALVDYLGDEAEPPRDITGWVIDRDLTDFSRVSLDVSLLLSRLELNNLLLALEAIERAIDHADLTQTEFFGALQAIVAQGIITTDNIDFTTASRLAETALLPKWIESLPYRSEILDMSNAMFESLTATDRAELRERLSAKVSLYRTVLASPDLWTPLNEGDDPIAHVTPISLIALP